jgi:hypothetical protein
MATWQQFAAANPELAAWGLARFRQFRVAYLATVRQDGAPWVHPVPPIVSDQNLFLFMEPTSPKGQDLKRDGRYALHSLVTNWDGSDGEFWVMGTAHYTADPQQRAEAVQAASYDPAERYILFRLEIDRAFGNDYVDGQPALRRWP